MLPGLKESKKKRVAAYVRVSTIQESQLESLQNQSQYYKKKIEDTANWELAGIYIDEGISGTEIRKRNGMKELLKLANNKKVDLILCKSISRFARNTADLLKTIRKLKEYGVEVVFEKEKLSSMHGDGELMLSLLGMFAQNESESISTNIKWRIQKDRENGISTPRPKVLGYKWQEEKLVIDEEEAKVVREIYKMYEDGMSGRRIANELNTRIKYRSLSPTLQNRHFDSSSILYTLRNPIYSGDLLLGKYYTTSPVNKKTKRNKGERDMYLVEDNHEAIIEKRRWEKIQELIKEKTNGKSKKN